jgi:hypothetical protein
MLIKFEKNERRKKLSSNLIEFEFESLSCVEFLTLKNWWSILATFYDLTFMPAELHCFLEYYVKHGGWTTFFYTGHISGKLGIHGLVYKVRIESSKNRF